MAQINWDEYFFKICDAVASKSKDPSTKVGSVIVGLSNEIRSTGYNGFPRGVNDSVERLNDRPTKYQFIVHAELNAILGAARNGVSLVGCSLYTHWYPCHECAKAIVQSGISQVIVDGEFMKRRGNQNWEDSFKISEKIFQEAGIDVIISEEEIEE